MKSIVVIYSPLCEYNGAFLGQLEEWFNNIDLEIITIPFDKLTTRELEWYKAAGVVIGDRFVRSVFIDVFSEGLLIDSVPLSQRKIIQGLGLEVEIGDGDATTSSEAIQVNPTNFRKILCRNEVEWNLLNFTNYHDEMKLCLENYPFGNPANRFHQRCYQVKEKIFTEVFIKEHIAGVFATWQGKVIGLLEVFPREIIKQYGYLTGTNGNDLDYLTVGCLEIGYGIPRTLMLDELMFHLEAAYPKFSRPLLEGIGRLEWPSGFTPYWVYDKYGFQQSEIINKRTKIMEKRIHKS